ncbi:hypothetical protein JTE90_021806 [Oedothorax gibbosus]|uniref:Uncharacterized protein n=1 Tax=Oedothorax gibbosus TaxID=931172 RepID=A0AAV6TXE5_9ARAC|nr:hypothetical protein JTE90_021806 [Oedothorax gibbosus]
MEPNVTQSVQKEEKWPIPPAAILCLSIALYIVLIVIGLLIRKCLIARGICTDCFPKMKSESECCGSCGGCAQQCNWKVPTVDSCLDAICPAKQRVNCIEFLVCDWENVQCCNDGGTYTCGSGDYACTWETPKCDNINCLCCEISFRNGASPPPQP